MFLSLNFPLILELVHFETLDQFSHSSFKKYFDLVLLINFFWVYLMFRMYFKIVFDLFILFDTCLL